MKNVCKSGTEAGSEKLLTYIVLDVFVAVVCHWVFIGSFSPHCASVCPLFVVKNGKNGKPHVLVLQNKEHDDMVFDLATNSLEELFDWYQVTWDIAQREASKQYNKKQEVSYSNSLNILCTGMRTTTSKYNQLEDTNIRNSVATMRQESDVN